MDDIAIEVDSVSKHYKLYHEKSKLFHSRISDSLLGRVKHNRLQVLKDVSFTVQSGEMVGIIGNNGAGKTTLLRIIAGIIKPSSGRVVTKGKMIPFLGLGAGFSQDLSAVDNIVLYGMILGFSKKTMIEKVPDVLKYAGLEKFADVAIRNFSSGMHARLAFSTAILVDPDILLLDEVLSVGDHSFRKKSYGTFMEMIERNKTVIMVSHSLNQISQLCDRAIWLHDGGIRATGDPEDVIKSYVESQQEVPEKKNRKAARSEWL